MGQLSYMQSDFNRNVVIWRMTVIIVLYLLYRGKNWQIKEVGFFRLTFVRLTHTIRISYTALHFTVTFQRNSHWSAFVWAVDKGQYLQLTVLSEA